MANLRIGRRSGLVLRGGRQRRDSIWLATATSEFTIAAASTTVLAFALGASALALRPFTIVRERNNWFVRSDVVTGGEVWGCALGACVVTEQANAIGSSAVPTPITDQDSDQFYMYDEIYGRFGGTAVEEVGARKVVESKAMRKVGDNDQAIIVFETPSFVSSATIVFGGRFLIKLH